MKISFPAILWGLATFVLANLGTEALKDTWPPLRQGLKSIDWPAVGKYFGDDLANQSGVAWAALFAITLIHLFANIPGKARDKSGAFLTLLFATQAFSWSVLVCLNVAFSNAPALGSLANHPFSNFAVPLYAAYFLLSVIMRVFKRQRAEAAAQPNSAARRPVVTD